MVLRLLTAWILFTLGAPVMAAVKTEIVEYTFDGTTYKGYLAYDDATADRRPGVLVLHEWWGLDEHARKRAIALAEIGYVAFAADLYGNGKTTEHPNEAGEMASQVRANAKSWVGRSMAALDQLKKHPKVEPSKLAAIGYCFGGSTALQLALSGADLRAVVSFHGALPVPNDAESKAVKAKILICHGAADTFIPDEVCQKFRKAMEKAGVDYQFVYFGNARHSFTVKAADGHGIDGLRYDAKADARSWSAMRQLFREAFGE